MYSACASRIARRFVKVLDAGDTSCAARIKEVRTVDHFPGTAADAEAARSRAGDESRPTERRAAAVAAAMVADAIQRWSINYSGKSRGLRGGRWSWRGDDTVEFRFDRARFAADVAVSGSATWERASGAVRAAAAGRLVGRPAEGQLEHAAPVGAGAARRQVQHVQAARGHARAMTV